MTIAIKLFLPILFLFIGSFSYAQEVNTVTPEDQEFYRQVKLTKEFKAIQDSIKAFNADENNIPQEYKFEIARDKKREEVERGQFIYGILVRKLAVMDLIVDGYIFEYNRYNGTIISINYFKTLLEVAK